MAEETTEEPTEMPIEKTEEKPTKKVEEEKPEKAKKKRRGVFTYYKIEKEGGLKRLLPFCERCGPGYFMADHDDRYTCGHCGFTRYKRSEKSK